MDSSRARILGALAAVVLVLGGVVVLTRDDGGDDDASEVETEDDTTTSTRRESTTSSSEADDTTSTTKRTTSTTDKGSSGSPPSSSTTAAPSPPTTARAADPFASARIKLTRVVSLDYPIAMAVRPSDGSLWIARKGGTVCRLSGTACSSSQTVASVSAAGEQGLLGIAFNPAGTRFYASYTNPAGDTRLDEFPMQGNTVGVAQRRNIFAEDQPESNHNGGNIVFGPDGRLYLGLGDGGGGGDEHGSNGNGQNPNTDLGKVLRINPAGPTVQRWISGVRNPWRFSFDRSSGALWVADVGQGTWEEVTYLPAGAQQGRNLGWRCYEGTHRFGSCTPSPSHTGPIYEYDHDPGCSITGGYVYRGSKIPKLVGAYLFADYCDGQIRGFTLSGGKVRTVRGLRANPGNVVSFGQAANGDLYVLTPSAVFRIDPRVTISDDRLLEVLHDTATAVRVALDGLSDWGSAGTRAGLYRSDLAADEVAVSRLLAAGLAVMSEESGYHERERDVTVVVDPVDGSTNASRAIPWYATSLCAVDGDGLRAALVVDQASGARYEAVRGAGARVDGQALAPSACTDLADAVVGLSGYPPQHLGWKQFRAFGALALDLCAVAAGRLDAFIDCSPSAHGPWDYLGGMLICTEAGALVTDAEGRELVTTDHAARRTPVAAATPALFEQVTRARRGFAGPGRGRS